jgi:hypothetical protein
MNIPLPIPGLSWGKLLLKILPYLAVIAAVGGAIWFTYSQGFHNGSDKVQAKWNVEKLRHEQELTKLRTQIKNKETAHQIESQRISDELADANEKHAAAIAALDAGFHERLSNSEQRAVYYQRISASGTVEQRNLASHAAELDRSLEEGRRLVQELSATLRQRDAQNTALGQQILSDRALVGEKNESNSAPAE